MRHLGPERAESYRRTVYAVGSQIHGGMWIWKETNVFASFDDAEQCRVDRYADMLDVKVFTLYVQ